MKAKIALLLLLLGSFILYTFRIDRAPSIYVDEAVVGYDAYSILSTGKDHHGQQYPIYFRFFGAYTPGLYVYALLPLIKLFGLSPYTIRILSSISGVISIFVFYKFLEILLKSSSKSLIGSAFYAIIPWSVFNSRLGYEVMFAATIFNAGVYLLAKNTSKYSYLGLFLISLSTYAAHTQRFLAPIFLIMYFIFILKPKLKEIIFLCLTQLPNFYMLSTEAFWIKTSATSIKYLIIQIISYLSPRSLFFELPDIDLQHQIPRISIFFWWMILPLIIGVYHQFRSIGQIQKVIIIWIVASIVPASLSGEFISIQRALPLLFPLMLIIATGISRLSYLAVLILFPYSLILIFRSYFFLLPTFNSKAWNYGYHELSQFMLENQNSNFFIDNTRNPRNYILPLFYSKIDYQKTVSNYYSVPQISDYYQYSNATFDKLDWSQDLSNYKYLVSDGLSISEAQAREHKLTKIKTIVTPTNDVALEIYQR